MSFFPLAGAALFALILSVAVVRWVGLSWWRGELGDEILKRWLPHRDPPPAEPVDDGRPALRLIRGGRDGEPTATNAPRHARGPRDR